MLDERNLFLADFGCRVYLSIMNPANSQEAVEVALDGILNNRLALIAGAGLSMAEPSNLPSAAHIANLAKAQYDARYGATRPALSDDIEEQAQMFFEKDELGVYLSEFVDNDIFAAHPNAGHIAVADLLLSQGLRAVISTNVDTLIETAGQTLLGQVPTALDGTAIVAAAGQSAPLLKVHGCWQQDRPNTVWAPGQLEGDPVKDRIEKSAAWMQTALLDKDLLIIGYSTDWDYLNRVVEQTLGAVTPSSVLVVDPSDTEDFINKAPVLAELAAKSKKGARHLKMSGADFLDALRLEFSRTFFRQAVAQGAAGFTQISGDQPSVELSEPPVLSNGDYWKVRRDLLGCRPNQPAKQSHPFNEPAIGLTLLQLRQAGAVPEGPLWRLNDKVIRVLRASNSFLHEIEATYRWELPPMASPDIVVAVGSEDTHLPADLVRTSTGSIARGSATTWMTRQAFEGVL